jgi:hypothetical protein
MSRSMVNGGSAAAKPVTARIAAKLNAARIEASIGGGVRGACFTPRPLLGKPPIPEFART